MAGAVAAFIFLATRTISVPGLYYDELIQDVLSLRFVKGDLASPVAWIPQSQIWIVGHPLPLMTLSYIGAVKTAAFIPIVWLFGITPASVRYFSIAIAAVSLVVTYAFARRLLGTTVAVLAVLLLAVDPSFVFYSRVDFGPTVFMMLAKSIALWQFMLWWRTGRTVYLLLAFAALGIGVYDKADFVWVIGALAISACLLVPKQIALRLRPRNLLPACSAFVVAALPLVLWNLSWPPRTWSTLQNLSSAQRMTTGSLVNQVWARAQLLADLLDGRRYAGADGGLLPPQAHAPILSALLCLGILLLLVQWRLSRGAHAQPARFALLCTLLIPLLSALTGVGADAHHIILAYPFPHLVIALGIASVASMTQRWTTAALPSVAVMVALTALAVLTSVTRVEAGLNILQLTGGQANWSDAIYKLADYFSTQAPTQKALELDWGIHYPLVGLTQGRVTSVELWPELADNASSTILDQAFSDAQNRYILHAAGATNFSLPREAFFQTAAALGCSLRKDASFDTRSGATVLEVYEVDACQR